ncbi:hypothetical protein PV327_008971 [Microctonus hyperodae]|uniref:Iron-binding zinc finger CDGSH type domain-containing protein n=1 Tax=Microctonus hyperodae TaxID=165561 RepID=A0AA39FST5_MICHY|nr:hypothetical protein PV327_008971 [Microctonus hyperodae]
MNVTKFTQNFRTSLWKVRLSSNVMRYSTKKKDEPEIPKNELEGFYTAQYQPCSTKMYDKKPFKMRLIAGKVYSWCSCGHGHGQPLCDGTHKNIFLKITSRPIKFQVKETKEYWLCNCKQTSNRPFCDGTHLRPDIQEKKYF